jgi:hypothetical protein
VAVLKPFDEALAARVCAELLGAAGVAVVQAGAIAVAPDGCLRIADWHIRGYLAREWRVRDRTLSVRAVLPGRTAPVELAVLVDQAVDEETPAPHAHGPFPPTLRLASVDHTRETWEALKAAVDDAFDLVDRRSESTRRCG